MLRLMWESGAVRDKWQDRSDYLPRTIVRALSKLWVVYTPPVRSSLAVPSPHTPTCEDTECATPHLPDVLLDPPQAEAPPQDTAAPLDSAAPQTRDESVAPKEPHAGESQESPAPSATQAK